jgi:hypothetical protein
MRCESCAFPSPSTFCVSETRRCHSRDKGHFRGGTLVLSRLVPSRSSRLSCAMACTSLSSSCVDSSIAFAFFSCSKMRPPSALLGFCVAKVCAARYARNCSVLLRSYTLRFSQEPLNLGLKVVGDLLITSPKPSGRRAMQLGLLHGFGHAFGYPRQ